MTRRPTPVLVKTGAKQEDSCAVPLPVDTEEARGIAIAEPNTARNTTSAAPPPPSRNGEPLTLWICDPPACAPVGSTACTPEQATAWAHGALPEWLQRRRIDGVLVQCDPVAESHVRRAARSLRDRITPHEAAGLRELAAWWGNAAVMDAIARSTSNGTPTFADLARALARGDEPDAAHLARLCWALEHL
jgi:hypothetical protein